MPTDPLDKQLLTDALELVEAARRPAATGDVAALDVFRARSEQHARAVDWASDYLDALPVLDSPHFSADDRRRIRRQARWARLGERPALIGGVAASAVGVVVFGFLWRAPQEPPPEIADARQAPAAIAYTSGRGVSREIRLEDASTVWLDWATEIAVTLAADGRRVELLQGRAAFAVEPDPLRPFEVVADGTTTRVVGTEFVVDRRVAGRIDVAVVEGRVVVGAGTQPGVALTAGQTVRSEAGALGRVGTRPSDDVGNWRDGLIVVRDLPLGEALRRLEPYSSYTIDLRDFETTTRISATFLIERADDAVTALIQTYRLRMEYEPPNRLRLLAPPAEATPTP